MFEVELLGDYTWCTFLDGHSFKFIATVISSSALYWWWLFTTTAPDIVEYQWNLFWSRFVGDFLHVRVWVWKILHQHFVALGFIRHFQCNIFVWEKPSVSWGSSSQMAKEVLPGGFFFEDSGGSWQVEAVDNHPRGIITTTTTSWESKRPHPSQMHPFPPSDW